MDNIEFLPEKVRSQRARQKRIRRQVYLLGLCVVAMTALAYFRQGRISSATADVTMLQVSADTVQCLAAKRQVLEQQLAEMAIKQRVEEILGSRISAQLVLSELQHVLPPSITLTSMEFETMQIEQPNKPGPSVSVRAVMAGNGVPKKETLARIRLTIVGLAPNDVDVANFIGQLSTSPLFEEVTMGYSKGVAYHGRSAREFRASCYVTR